MKYTGPKKKLQQQGYLQDTTLTDIVLWQRFFTDISQEIINLCGDQSYNNTYFLLQSYI